MHKNSASIPVITTAQPNFSTDILSRKKTYLRLMSLRIPVLLLAVGIFSITHLVWLPLCLVVISVPLPWVAVLMANDRPPQQKFFLLKVLGIKKHSSPISSHQPVHPTNDRISISPVIIDAETLDTLPS